MMTDSQATAWRLGRNLAEAVGGDALRAADVSGLFVRRRQMAANVMLLFMPRTVEVPQALLILNDEVGPARTVRSIVASLAHSELGHLLGRLRVGPVPMDDQCPRTDEDKAFLTGFLEWVVRHAGTEEGRTLAGCALALDPVDDRFRERPAGNVTPMV